MSDMQCEIFVLTTYILYLLTILQVSDQKLVLGFKPDTGRIYFVLYLLVLTRVLSFIIKTRFNTIPTLLRVYRYFYYQVGTSKYYIITIYFIKY